MRKYSIYFFLFVSVFFVISLIFIVNVSKKDPKLTESIEAARLISGAHVCMSARYAYLMLQTINLQKSDCFVCSASGIPPKSCINGGEVTPFSNFEITAYIISGSPIKKNTIPLSITIFGIDSEEEEISTEAKISPITENFYTAEFLLPRDKLPTYVPAFIDIKCGIGGKYTYSLFVDSERINPHIFMNDSNMDALSKSSDRELRK